MKHGLFAATALMAASVSIAQAAPIKTGFETIDNVSVPAAPVPTIVTVGTVLPGVPLSANSEINDEFAGLRINSGAAASGAGDTFGAVASWVQFDIIFPERGRVIAGAAPGASGNDLDFRNFVEIRLLDPGHDFFSAFVGAVNVGTFSVIVTADVGGSDVLLNSAALAPDGTFTFTNTDASKDIRRVVFFAGPTSDGIYIDDVCAAASAAECASTEPPPPPPPPSTAAPTPATAALLAPFVLGGLILRRRRHA